MKIGRLQDELRLTVTDDGVGFELETAELGRGYELPNIKDRVERLGELLEIETSPGKGVTLNICIPLPGDSLQSPLGR